MGRLRDGEWIAGAGALALLAAMFLHWYGTDLRIVTFEVTAWQAFDVLDAVLVLLALVPLALVFTQATRRSPSIPVAFSVLTAVAGVLAALLILYRIVNQPGPNDLISVEAGAYVGLLAGLGVFLGAWLSLSDERPRPVDPPPPEPQRRPTPARS
jgi:hypothetical protein